MINNCLIAKPPSNLKPFTHSCALPNWVGRDKGKKRGRERRDEGLKEGGKTAVSVSVVKRRSGAWVLNLLTKMSTKIHQGKDDSLNGRCRLVGPVLFDKQNM